MELRSFPLAMAAFFLLSAHGWGQLCRPFCDRRLLRFHTLAIVLGIAVLNVAGGLLNLARLATPWALTALLIAGAAASGLVLMKSRRRLKVRWSKAQAPLLVALGFGAAASWLLMPSELFNCWDDFFCYIVRVVRMSQTGTLGGNPFDLLGLESLGSQAFFDGFFLQGQNIRYLNGFDAVVCFALCLCLAAELSVRWRLPWGAGVLAVLCAVAINPQSVNISALYSGVLAIMALVVCGLWQARTLIGAAAGEHWRIDLSLALVLAWLVSLKLTIAEFGVFFLLPFYGLLMGRVMSSRLLASLSITLGATGLFVLPWVFVVLPTLLKARRLGAAATANAPVAADYSSLAAHDISSLFSPAPLLYGGRPLSFLLIATVCLAIGLIASLVWLLRAPKRSLASAPAIAAAGLAVPMVFLVNGHLFKVLDAVRYSCPVIIGGFVPLVLCCLRFARGLGQIQSRRLCLALCGCMLAVLILFSGSFWSRARLAAANRTLLAFPFDATYPQFCNWALSRSKAAYDYTVQTNVPAGTGILVWTSTPFQLDFSRNPVFSISVNGIIHPVLRFPTGANVEAFEDYLRGFGMDYVLLETNSYSLKELPALRGVENARYGIQRKEAEFGLYLYRILSAITKRDLVRYADGNMVLIELRQKTAPAQQDPAQTDNRPQPELIGRPP